MRIDNIVHVANKSGFDGESNFWIGKVTEISNGGREITVQDKGINFAVLDVDDLIFKDGEYWEK